MGIVYLVQPAELVGTNRYKIGCSADSESLKRIVNGYKKGTRYLHICDCVDHVDAEKQLICVFKTKFSLIAGHEYFQGDEIDIRTCFVNECLTFIKTLVEPFDKGTPIEMERTTDTIVKIFIKTFCQITNNKRDRVASKDLYEAFKRSDYYDASINKNVFPDYVYREGLTKMKSNGIMVWTRLKLYPEVVI